MLNSLGRYPVTYALIALNLLVFLYSAIQPNPFTSESLVDLGAIYGWYIATRGEWWRVVTGIFLHGGITHVALNMISLYIIGRIAEELFGKSRYTLLYMVSGIAGAIVSVVMHPDGLSVGASGAIFGIFGAIAGYALAHRDSLGERFKRFMREFGTVLLLNIVLGFSIPGIDMSAHIGGLIIGAIGGYVSRYKRGLLVWSTIVVLIGFGYLVFGFPSLFAPQQAMY